MRRRSDGSLYERLNLRVSKSDAQLVRAAVALAALRGSNVFPWRETNLSTLVRPWLREKSLELLRTIKPAELEKIPDAGALLGHAISIETRA